jgi:hypothetical protein
MSVAMSNNPTYANNVVGYPGNADTSNNESLTAAGLGYFGLLKPTVTASGDTISTRADGALWDNVAGAYVSIQNTTCGTTACPKNGQ